MISAIGNATESIQICLKLPKFAQRQLAWRTLKYDQKFRFLMFLRK
jgi:hypothetical protein